MRTRTFTACAAIALLSGCPAPVATTAAAVGAAGYQVSRGRCVAACSPGYACNPKTGFCEPLPCPAGCPAGQACVQGPTGARCEPAGLEIHQQSGPAPRQGEQR